jgi:hypothetical protein
MKKIIALIGFLMISSFASAQLVFTSIPQTTMANSMVNDPVFFNDVVVADKTGLSDFSFGVLNFTILSSATLDPFDVVEGTYIDVDYLGKSAADENDLSFNIGLGDTVLFDHYGVVDGYSDSQGALATADAVLSFWNNDVTKGIFSSWSNPDHFKVYRAAGPNGAEFYLIAIDDRGTSQPKLQDWNDGVFLMTTYVDPSQIAVPEPSAVGFLASLLILGLSVIRRKR